VIELRFGIENENDDPARSAGARALARAIRPDREEAKKKLQRLARSRHLADFLE
jgi:hypothetical protein